jgi:PAS domain S-box-containing protein
MEAAANGIIITDPNGIILWTNPAITQISGYTYPELVGQSTRLFNSGRQDPNFYQQMWETILAGNVWQGDTVNRRKDGGHYVEEQTITPVRDKNGQISHFIAVKQDITERKLIYSQLEDSNRELKILTTSERQQRLLAEGLVESSVALNMSLELHAVLDRIIEQTRRTIPYSMADIVLIDEDVANVVRQWVVEANSNPRTIFENDNLELNDFPVWDQICSRKSAIRISDTSLENQWKTYFGMAWVRSYLGAPLIYNDQVIGIINLISDQANAFHEGMAKTLRAFAAPAAVAIQNARSYEDEQHNRKLAEILSAASVALAQTLDIQMVMETILDYVQFVMQFDVAFVVLSEGEERYRIRSVRTGDHNTELQNLLVDQAIDMLSQPLVRSYLSMHESTLISDSREIPNWDPPAGLARFNCWLGVPLESMGKVLGLVVVAHTIPHSFGSNQIEIVEAVVKQAVVALQNAWLFEQVRSGRERLQQLSRHLVEIQENERKYIARELHDETSQSLTSLKLGLQVIEQKAAGHEQLMEQVLHLKKLADETLESLHHLAVNLRPASLDHLGLVDALTGLIESTRQRSGLSAHLKTMGIVPSEPLTDEMETSIYRIVQESITNVVRHANATYVDVILEWQEAKIVIIIEDDGVGIDMQKAREKGHLGLIGMQERAEMLGGSLLVDSEPQVGTTLVVEIPYVN